MNLKGTFFCSQARCSDNAKRWRWCYPVYRFRSRGSEVVVPRFAYASSKGGGQWSGNDSRKSGRFNGYPHAHDLSGGDWQHHLNWDRLQNRRSVMGKIQMLRLLMPGIHSVTRRGSPGYSRSSPPMQVHTPAGRFSRGDFLTIGFSLRFFRCQNRVFDELEQYE